MAKIPSGAWVLVADGSHARLFHNVGEHGQLSLKQSAPLTLNEHDAQGPSGHHRPADSHPKEIGEATFAKQLANYLNAAALKQEYAHLLLIADPKTLGEIRPQLHEETRRRLIEEVAKTLTNATLENIEANLSEGRSAVAER